MLIPLFCGTTAKKVVPLHPKKNNFINNNPKDYDFF